VRTTAARVTHSNFMSRERWNKRSARRVLDIQRSGFIWTRHAGEPIRLRATSILSTVAKHFQGGWNCRRRFRSHLQKIAPFAPSIPTIRFSECRPPLRAAKWYDGKCIPKKALTREQAIRFYRSQRLFAVQRRQSRLARAAKLRGLHCPILICDRPKTTRRYPGAQDVSRRKVGLVDGKQR